MIMVLTLVVIAFAVVLTACAVAVNEAVDKGLVAKKY